MNAMRKVALATLAATLLAPVAALAQEVPLAVDVDGRTALGAGVAPGKVPELILTDLKRTDLRFPI